MVSKFYLPNTTVVAVCFFFISAKFRTCNENAMIKSGLLLCLFIFFVFYFVNAENPAVKTPVIVLFLLSNGYFLKSKPIIC